MSGRAMNKKSLFVISLLLIAAGPLAGCDAPPTKLPLDQAPLAGARIGAPFGLTDQTGKVRQSSEWDGGYQIVYFGYTSCPDICTPDTQNLMAGLKLFEQSEPKLGAKIQPLFITIDPQRDTPEVLAQFVRAFHPRLIGLTGTLPQIAAVSKSYAIYSSRTEGSRPDAYLMAHSQTPYLMGPDNKPLALMPVDDPKTDANEGRPQAVVAELSKWVR
jgi:protein SCO1